MSPAESAAILAAPVRHTTRPAGMAALQGRHP
jgi:hypothetical protein